MWLNYGKNTMTAGIATFLAIAILVVLNDSYAQAGLLKNSVRVGDRTKMTIIQTPRAGQRKRIRLTPPSPTPGASSSRAAPRPRLALGWFWEEHSITASSASPARWENGLASLRGRRDNGGAIHSEARLSTLAQEFGVQVSAAARKHKVSEMLLLAVIAVESAGQSKAVSPKGARGLMQLIPATARRFGVGDSFDPTQNINGGAAYLSWLLNRFGEDPILALAGYNAGEGAVDKHKGVPPYAETRDYVVKVFDALAAAEALCLKEASTPRERCRLPGSILAAPST